MTWQAGGLQAGGTYDDANNIITGPSHNPAQWPGISVFFAGRLVNPPSGAYPAISYCAPHGESHGNWVLAYEAGGAPVWKPGNNSSALYLIMDISGERTLCGTWARQGMARLYADGREIASGVKSNDWPGYSQPHLINGFYRQDVHRSSAHLYQCLYVYNRELSSLEVQTLNANPYCMFQQDLDIGAFEYVDAGGTYVDLAGSIAATPQLAASLKKYVGLSGSAQITAAASSGLKATRGISGVIDGDPDIAGSLRADRRLSGEIAAAAGMDAVMRPYRGLAGSIEARAEMAGMAKIYRALVGSIAAQAGMAGVLSIAGTVELSGSIGATADMAASMRVRIGLAGQVDAQADMSGTLRPFRGVAGAIEAAAEILGAATGVRGLAGSIQAPAELSGGLSADLGLSGSIAATADISGRLRLVLSFAGSIDALADLLAGLSTFVPSTLGDPIDVTIESVTPRRAMISITIKRTITEV